MTKQAEPPRCEKHECEQRWYNDKNRKAGGKWMCPKCHSQRGKRHYEANREEINQKSRDWYAANREYHNSLTTRYYQDNREHLLEVNKAWAKANPDACRETSARYRANHPEQEAANQAKWAKKNPDQCQASSLKYRALKRNALIHDQPVTSEVIKERLAQFEGCAYCGADEKLSVDHFIALSDGGLHIASNLVGACTRCNSSKKDRPVEGWFKSQHFYNKQRWHELLKATEIDSTTE